MRQSFNYNIKSYLAFDKFEVRTSLVYFLQRTMHLLVRLRVVVPGDTFASYVSDCMVMLVGLGEIPVLRFRIVGTQLLVPLYR